MNPIITENKNEKKTTYSLPVYITGGAALLLTIMVGVFGIISTAKVREADPATLAEAKQQANAMVPVQNANIKESIELALLDTDKSAPPEDLNLKNPFVGTLGTDRVTAAKNSPIIVTPQPPVQPNNQIKLQPGAKTSPDAKPLRLAPIAKTLPERPVAPTLPSFEVRYQMWEQQIAEAQRNKIAEPSVGQIYAVAEVTPTGYLASGDRKLVNFEVNQKDKNAAESFSLEQGERLFDATVSEVTETGVFYQFNDGNQVFRQFVTERDLKKSVEKTAPTSTAPTATVLGVNSSISKVTRSLSADNAAAIVDGPTYDTLPAFLAKADLESDYINANYIPKNLVVEKQRLTDNDYFHPIGFKNGNQSSRAAKQDLTPCDAEFVGENIRYTSSANLTLSEFLRDLQKLYGISFIVDQDVTDETVFLKVLDKPWNYVLESILRSKSLEARCLTGGIISIEPKGKQIKVDQENEKAELEKQKSEPLFLKKYNLRYIPLNSSSSAQIAGSVGGSTVGGSGNNAGPGIEGQINQLLNRGGDNRASISRIPNSNILAVYATARQHGQIKDFIDEIDKPGFQVIIETNFYTVNDSNFRDLGGQFGVIVGNGAGTNLGGISTIPTTTGDTTQPAQPVPGRNLPPSFGQPNGNLRAGGNTLFGASFTVGTATFEALFSAAEQKGLANSQARSTQAVLDGGTTEIKNGDTIVIPTTGSTGGSLVTSGAITVNATQSALMQPQVVVNEKGEPVAVTLNLQLSNNSINRAFLGTTTPVIATQSQSGTVRLPLNQTYVVSGFFTDSVSNIRNNTPGLSKIPGLGELFKRRTNQIDRNRLYFAISVRVVRDTDLMNVPAPSDIDTRPVPPPAPQTPAIRKDKKNKKDKKNNNSGQDN